ncbi:hypothetical protein L914_07800, partial [Phytophthora nicotianae]
MVTVSHPIRPSFTSAQVSRFFFQPCRDDYDEIIDEYFRCRCGTVRKQTRRNGFTNLLQHVRREHPDFETRMREASTTETGSLLSYVRQSSQNLYGWLTWVIMSNLSLAFCENRATRRTPSVSRPCALQWKGSRWRWRDLLPPRCRRYLGSSLTDGPIYQSTISRSSPAT